MSQICYGESILVVLSPKQHKTSRAQQLHKVQYKRVRSQIILKECKKSTAKEVPWAKEPVTKPKKQLSMLASSF